MKLFGRAAAAVLLAASAAADSPPSIQITSLPAFGDPNGILHGQVTGLVPGQYRVAVLLFVSGTGWFSKPVCNGDVAETTPLTNGAFTTDVTTGGSDRHATMYAVLVLPGAGGTACVRGQDGVPESLKRQAVAAAIIPRQNPAEKQLMFANDTWAFKWSPEVQTGPESNYFCDGPNNAFVDSQNRLHLRLTLENNRWCAVELVSRKRYGYGRYTLQLATPAVLDPNVVFGAFTWAEAEANTREIDLLEIFDEPLDAHNVQYVVQPWQTAGNRKRFTLPSIVPSNHTMVWRPDSLHFQSTAPDGSLLNEFVYGSTPPVPDSPRLNFRLNLWLRIGAAPTNGQPAEVIISNFTYEPLPSACGAALARSFDAFTEQGGSGTVDFPAASNCAWLASSDATWAQVYPLSHTGPRAIEFTIFPNFRTTGRAATFNVGGNIFSIEQSAGIGSGDRRFIRLLYYFFYGRLPSESEVAFHVGSGLSRPAMARNFMTSAEFNLGGRFVTGLYSGLLGRSAEYSGWIFQRNAMAGGLTNPNILVGNFINSAEFKLKHGELTDAEFIRLLYRQALGREPSPIEIQGQMAAIVPFSRVQFAANILNSIEFRSRVDAALTAFLLAATLLQRHPSPPERQTYETDLRNGVSLESVIAAILGGAEFNTNLQ